MKFFFYILIFLNFLFCSFAIADDKRSIEIYKNIRCLVCQGQTLHDSNSNFSKDLKKIIQKKIKEGHSDKKIYNYLVERYGDWILFSPPLKSTTLLLWAIPLVMLFIGIIILFRRTIFEKSKMS